VQGSVVRTRTAISAGTQSRQSWKFRSDSPFWVHVLCAVSSRTSYSSCPRSSVRGSTALPLEFHISFHSILSAAAAAAALYLVRVITARGEASRRG
jgi:hypothetical protein